MNIWILSYIIASVITGIFVFLINLFVISNRNIEYIKCENCRYKLSMGTVWYCKRCERIELNKKIINKGIPVKKLVSEEL